MKIFLKTFALTFLYLFLSSTFVKAKSKEMDVVDYSKDIIYQIITDRFDDGDSSNNPSGNIFSPNCTDLHKYCGGDWQGIIDKIKNGYLTDLGVTALWISQPVENIYALHPNGYTSYHGYWSRDYKRTNPFYGGFSDFDQLIKTAHANGIKIIMDFAPNHSSPASETNPTYAEGGAVYDNGSFIANYYNDPGNIFNHHGETDFSTYEDSIYRRLFDLADYNLNNSKMDTYLKESIKLWLDKGIDGIRIDAVKHMPLGWQKSFTNEIYSHQPVFTFGEWFLGKGEIDPKNYYFANESGMSLLDFRFGKTIRSVLRDHSHDWYDFHEMIKETAKKYNEVNDQVTFIDNHDMARFTTENSSKRFTDMALAVLMTSRGVPTIYYGTEQYLTGDYDPINRKPMREFDKTTNSYQVINKLSALRKSNSALGYGDTKERWINSDVYIYERTFGNKVVVTAINKANHAYSISNLYTSLPQGDYKDVLNYLLDGNNLSVKQNGVVESFQLQPKAVAVWEFSKPTKEALIGHVGRMKGQPGNTIYISGEGFGKQKGSVIVGSKSAEILNWSNTNIKIKIPEIDSGVYDILLKTAHGSQSNVYKNFEVLTGKQVSVRFVVNNAYTNFGENIYLTGNVGELGNWNTEKAIGPMFNQIVYKYPTWYYEVSVPANKGLEYKFIKKDESGSVIWESGTNHVYITPKQGTDTVIVDWKK